MTVIVYGKPITITQETIERARQWYADNARACIAGARSGKFHVNNLAEYVEGEEQRAQDYLSGVADHTLAFAQMAVYLQTGRSVPIMS